MHSSQSSLADLTYHGPYARPSSTPTPYVVWVWIPVHPPEWAHSRSWPRQLKKGWPIYGQTVICAPPDAQKRRRHVRKPVSQIVGWVWSEYVYCGPEGGRHPEDPLGDPAHPDHRLHVSHLSEAEATSFHSWLTDRKNVV